MKLNVKQYYSVIVYTFVQKVNYKLVDFQARQKMQVQTNMKTSCTAQEGS